MSLIKHRLLPGLLAVLLLLMAGVVWLAGTESGLRVLWQHLLEPLVPELSSGAVTGRLAGNITISDLRYETDQLLFAARTLHLEWAPRGLLDGVVQIHRLAGEGVRYEQRGEGSDEPTELPARVTLPVAIDLQHLAITGAVIVSAPGAEPVAFDSLQLAGSYRDTRLDISQFALRRADLHLDGTATLHTEGDFALSGELRWEALPPGYAPLQAETRLSGSLRRLQLDQVVAAPYAVQASVLLNAPLAELQLEAAVELQATDLVAINSGWPDMRLAGTMAATGPPAALRLTGSVDLRDATAAALQLVFAGTLQPASLQLDTLRLSSPGRPSRLDAHGTIGLGAQPEFDFQAEWQALSWPLAGAAEYESKQGRFTLAGTADAYRLDAAGDLKYLDVAAGQLAVRARSGSERDSWQIETASFTGGSATVTASGLVGSRYDLDWQVDAPRIADLSPQATGSLRGSGRLVGSLPDLSISLKADAADIVFQEQRIGSLNVVGDVFLGDDRTSRLQGRLGDASLAGIHVTRLEVEGAGTTAQHSLKLKVDSGYGASDLDLTGRWDRDTWQFNLQQANLAYPQLASWQLAQPLTGELSRERLQLAEHCWVAGEARLCGHVAGTLQAYAGAFSLTDLPLAYFSAWLPNALDIDGRIQAQGDISKQVRDTTRINVRLDSSPVTLGLPQETSGEQQRISLAAGEATFTLAQTRAQLVVDLPLATGPGGVNANIQMGVPADGDWLQGKLDGEVILLWPDIGLAASWLPEVDTLRGRIDGRMQLAGTPAAPQLLGQLALTEAAATLVTPGLVLEDVSLELAGQPAGAVQVSAAASSGGGTLNGEGVVNLLERTASLAVRGSQFQVMNTPETQIFASPDLKLAVDGEQVLISGQIEVPRAQLRPRKLPVSAVSVSSDQVLVSKEEQDARAAPYAVDARVRLVLGDAVEIDGFGLSGKLQGNVMLVDLPQQPASATGEISIAGGRYEAYGQKLAIRTGRLLFAGGAVTKPGLDIEAVRKPAPDVLVGVKVRGGLQAPKFTVFSEPAMSQSAQLSWLVLGRPLEGGASDNERSTMQAAALALGMSGGESIGKRVGDQLGLDEVSIGSQAGEDETQASLLVGKYLTPELFVSYGIGLFEPISTLSLRYALSSRWKLVGQASVISSSADLIYQIERR
ncbi:MAG: translocation/assembly module TamB domain-containing protein [Gammaproteobacteria bacterium]